MGQNLVGIVEQVGLRIPDKVAEGVVDADAGRSIGRVQNHAHGGVVEHAAQHGVFAPKFIDLAQFPGQPVADQQHQDQDPGGDIHALGEQQQRRIAQDFGPAFREHAQS